MAALNHGESSAMLIILRRCRRLLDLKNLLVVNFLCLMLNLFFFVMQMNQGFWPVESYFKPVLDDRNKALMMETLAAFAGAMQAANVTFMMYGGTLIGAYRHHGPIPWDDDVDVIVNASQKEIARSALMGMEPRYRVYTETDGPKSHAQWKFHKTDLPKFLHKPFKWPYIDIFFFQENATYIWDEVAMYSKAYSFAKRDIFPLYPRMFGSMVLPAPCDTQKILAQNYHIDLCRSRQFSHMMELPMFSFSTKDVPCSRIKHVFPFVERTYAGDVVNETLKIDDYELHSVAVPAHCGRTLK